MEIDYLTIVTVFEIILNNKHRIKEVSLLENKIEIKFKDKE